MISAAQDNCKTRHLAKILVHLAWCLQECVSASGVPSAALVRALNALYISSVFLKYFIENAKSDHFEELHLSLDENEAKPTSFSKGDPFVPFCSYFDCDYYLYFVPLVDPPSLLSCLTIQPFFLKEEVQVDSK